MFANLKNKFNFFRYERSEIQDEWRKAWKFKKYSKNPSLFELSTNIKSVSNQEKVKVVLC